MAGKKIKVQGQGKSTYSKIFGYGIIVSPAQIIHNIQEWLTTFDFFYCGEEASDSMVVISLCSKSWNEEEQSKLRRVRFSSISQSIVDVLDVHIRTKGICNLFLLCK